MRTVSVPWNSDKCVGPRKELSLSEVQQIEQYLLLEKSGHDRCLFMLAIDSMLRCSDVLRLKVEDVRRLDGSMRETFLWKQKKTKKGVYASITLDTQKACREWISFSGKSFGDFLFTRGKGKQAQPISAGYYRDLIKLWVGAIGLDEKEYSTHSLRRTKPILLYDHDILSVENISLLLGHKDTKTTMHYLGLSRKNALEKARDFNIFSRKVKIRSESVRQPTFSKKDLDYLAQQVARLLKHRFDP